MFPPLAKVAAAYAGPMIAKRRAHAAGADEVVLLDLEGHVAEAPTSNVFAVIGGQLVTPPLGRILDGITRDSVLAVARAEGIPAHEHPLTLAAFAAADEAFLSASSFPIAPIASINGAPLAHPAPGPLTRDCARSCSRPSAGAIRASRTGRATDRRLHRTDAVGAGARSRLLLLISAAIDAANRLSPFQSV